MKPRRPGIPRVLAALCVVAVALCATAAAAPMLMYEGEGSVRVERIALSHKRGRATESRVYSVALFQVRVPLSLHIERGRSGVNGGEQNASDPRVASRLENPSPHGLSRLMCDSQLFESFAPPNAALHAHTNAGAATRQSAADALNADAKRARERAAGKKSGVGAGTAEAMPQWLVPPAPPAYLVPLNYYDEQSVHPLYHLVSSLFLDDVKAARAESDATGMTVLSYALLLSYTQPTRLSGVSTSGVVPPVVHVLDRRRLHKCRMTWLHARNQAVTPTGYYTTAKGEPVLASFTFEPFASNPSSASSSTSSSVNDAITAEPARGHSSSVSAAASASASAAAAAASVPLYYDDRSTSRAMFFASQSVFGSSGFAGWKALKLPCTYSPQTHGIFLQTHMSARGQTQLSTRAQSGAEATMHSHNKLKAGAGVVPIIAGLWKSLVQPLLDTLCEGVSDPIGSLLYFGVGDVMLPGLRDALHIQLTHAVPPAITEGLVPVLIETIPDTVTRHALRYIEDYTSATLPQRLQAEITHLIVPIAIEDISRLAKANIPRLTTVQAARVMGHMLTRALTLTVVPALSHTLSHAPYQEFYCRRCIEEQLMCSRCYYTIDKIYYAMFYASYYSTYYSDYYTTYYTNILEQQIAVQTKKQLEIRRFAERFETVFDDVAEYGGAVLGHGTWPGLIKIT